MSDWDKIINFSNSKQGGTIQFILVCIILLIMFGSQFKNQMGGKQRDGKQRDGKQRGGDSSWLDNKYLSLLLGILMFGLLVTGSVFIFGGKNIKI
jgi:hypothetical protein